MSIENAYRLLFTGAFGVLALLIGVMLIRSVIGPRITDRIMSINMLSTMVMCCIAILSKLFAESYLADVALIYAMISFTAVMMMAVMYIPANPESPVFPGRFAPRGKKKAKKSGEGRKR